MQDVLVTTGYADIPRYYTALAEWLCCMVICLRYNRKIGPRLFALTAAAALALQVAWMVLTQNVPIVLWIPCMVIAVIFMYIFLLNTLDATPRMAACHCAKAFLAAEFMAAFEWQVEYNLSNYGVRHPAIWLSLALPLYAAEALVFWLVERLMQRGETEPDVSHKELFSTVLIVIITFMLGNLSFVSSNTFFSGTMLSDVYLIRTLSDCAGLAILYANQSLRAEQHAEKELARIQSMLTAQYDSYRNYQEITDIINMKYHDLKHQIAGLRAENDPDRRAEWIDQLETELAAYRPERQTGNQVLDGVLDGKMPVIRKNQIQFTCVADGSLLSCLHVTDLCTIFGNALDNAIEHVILVPDPEQRVIHMEVSARKQFIYIEVRNYCEQEVRLRGGFPVTTKSDKSNHGFGIKSISYTVKKYGGTVQFGVEDHFFSIRMLIPRTT